MSTKFINHFKPYYIIVLYLIVVSITGNNTSLSGNWSRSVNTALKHYLFNPLVQEVPLATHLIQQRVHAELRLPTTCLKAFHEVDEGGMHAAAHLLDLLQRGLEQAVAHSIPKYVQSISEIGMIWRPDTCNNAC